MDATSEMVLKIAEIFVCEHQKYQLILFITILINPTM